jgi:hypothetical protein
MCAAPHSIGPRPTWRQSLAGDGVDKAIGAAMPIAGSGAARAANGSDQFVGSACVRGPQDCWAGGGDRPACADHVDGLPQPHTETCSQGHPMDLPRCGQPL